MTKEIVRVYAHDSNDDEAAYELADAFAEEGERFYRRLRGLAYEIAVYYEIDTKSGEIKPIGMKDGNHEIGNCPDPTWTYSWQPDPKPEDPHGDAETIGETHPGHVSVNVVDAETGEHRNALACEITEDDIEEDGTVSFPLSGTCPHDT